MAGHGLAFYKFGSDFIFYFCFFIDLITYYVVFTDDGYLEFFLGVLGIFIFVIFLRSNKGLYSFLVV